MVACNLAARLSSVIAGRPSKLILSPCATKIGLQDFCLYWSEPSKTVQEHEVSVQQDHRLSWMGQEGLVFLKLSECLLILL